MKVSKMVIRETIIGIFLAFCLVIVIASYAGGEKKKEASSSENVPESFTLGHIAKIYEPVRFSHGNHSSVAGECGSCHHHSEVGQTPPCQKCHGASLESKGSGMPGLKDAYHRQCMGCHKDMGTGPVGCGECHIQSAGSMGKVAPQAPVQKKPEKGSEISILDVLEKLYDPVTFSHGMHTLMAEDCATCHHHSEPGQTLACKECHGSPFDPKNLNMPGLKGAYHLHCMGCHQEMGSGPLGCAECHAKKVKEK